MNLILDDRDLRQLEQQFDAVAKDVEHSIRKGLSEGARIVSAEARSNHDYTDRTGALTRSIGAHPALRISANIWEALVTADAPHAAPIESGAAPHGIKPKRRGGMLTFKINGRWISKRFVYHPGNRAYRYLGNAVEAKADDVAQAVETRVIESFQRAGFIVGA